jgi:hypothetical protein
MITTFMVEFFVAATAGNDAINALHPLKPLPLSSSISASTILPQTVSSPEQEVLLLHVLLLYSLVHRCYSFSGEIQ